MKALAIIPAVALVTVSWCSQYAPGVMQEVIANRQAWGQIPDDLSAWDGFVAVPDCDDIGQTYYIRQHNSTDRRWLRVLAVDCANKTDRQGAEDARSGYEWMRDNNIAFEVDYATAVAWGMVGRGVRCEWLAE